jgi:feruloyl-CoA synthase
LLADKRMRSEFARLLDTLLQAGSGASSRICRAILLAELPSLDIGEMTDKGSINQRAVLANRAALVEDLYADPPPTHVITANR